MGPDPCRWRADQRVAPGRHGELRCIESALVVSVIWIGTDLNHRGAASADRMGDHWWVSRVVLRPPELRGQGIGSEMLRALMAGVARQGCQKLLVAPGGYEGDTERQTRFYARHGFEPIGDGTLVWKPC